MRQFINIVTEGEEGTNDVLGLSNDSCFVSYHIHDTYIDLLGLYAAERGTGAGAVALEKLISYADAHVLPIKLLADGDDRLVDYYEHFGFALSSDAWNNEMVRDATGLETGTPATTAEGAITYDARDGAMNVAFKDPEDLLGEEDTRSAVLYVESLTEARKGGAERMLEAAVDYASSQFYDLYTRFPLADDAAKWLGMQRQGEFWVCLRR